MQFLQIIGDIKMNNLVDIEDYTKRLTEELKMKFGKRLLYVGLQGSYRALTGMTDNIAHGQSNLKMYI